MSLTKPVTQRKIDAEFRTTVRVVIETPRNGPGIITGTREVWPMANGVILEDEDVATVQISRSITDSAGEKAGNKPTDPTVLELLKTVEAFMDKFDEQDSAEDAKA